jgi:hypothetical protein
MAERAMALARSAEARANLAERRARDAARLAQIVNSPPQAPGGRHAAPKPKRDRPPWLKVYPGGLAAFAPVAFLFHGGGGAVTMAAARWVWRSERARVVTTVTALAVGAAGAVPVVGAIDAAPAPALMPPPGHYHDQPPARPLRHGTRARYPVPPEMAQSGRHRRHASVRVVLPTVAPSPSPSPSLASLPPAPAPSATVPAGTVTGRLMPIAELMNLINQAAP